MQLIIAKTNHSPLLIDYKRTLSQFLTSNLEKLGVIVENYFKECSNRRIFNLIFALCSIRKRFLLRLRHWELSRVR